VAGDFIRVPPPQAFYEPINWTRTVCHEHIHYTGAAHRLNRDLSGSFGSAKYATEELVGEVGAAMLCAALGIVPTVRHADYLGAWLEVLHEDARAIVRAASAASKAADYLLSFLPGDAVTKVALQKDRHEPSAPPAGSWRPRGRGRRERS
jgi:antirestriction protein ArdC